MIPAAQRIARRLAPYLEPSTVQVAAAVGVAAAVLFALSVMVPLAAKAWPDATGPVFFGGLTLAILTLAFTALFVGRRALAELRRSRRR